MRHSMMMTEGRMLLALIRASFARFLKYSTGVIKEVGTSQLFELGAAEFILVFGCTLFTRASFLRFATILARIALGLFKFDINLCLRELSFVWILTLFVILFASTVFLLLLL